MKTLLLKDIENKEKWIAYEYKDNFIELKEELSKRNIQLGKNIKIYNKVRIGNSVRIGNNTKIKDFTIIGDRSEIYGNITVNSRVVIGDNVIIGSGLNIGYKTVIGNKANVYVNTTSNAIIDDELNLKRSFYIKVGIAGVHTIMYTGNGKLSIGCYNKKITEWLSICKELGRQYNYTKDQINEYKNYIKLAEIYYNKIKKYETQ